MLNENTENAVVEEVVNPQETVETTEVVETTEPTEVVETESVESEVATDTVEKQSKEDNAKFAEVRRKAEKAAIDKFISDQYGESHGIHTKEEYDKAIAEQRQKELLAKMNDGESDPMEVYNQMKANDPEYQAMKQSKQEAYIKNQLSELNNDLKGLELDVTINGIDDLVKLPNSDQIIKYVENGNTLSDAYFLANRQDIISQKTNQIQQNTIKQIEANGEATPGALSDNGNEKSYFTEDQVNNMSQAEVNKNLDLIYKSMKSW